MPVKKLSEATLKKLKEHSKDHGGAKHMNAMKKLMEEPPYPSMSKAHSILMKKDKKPMKKQTKKDRLDEAEGKKKGMKKKKQGTQARLDEAEGKKRGMKPPMYKKKKMATKY